MFVVVNGRRHEIEAGTTLAALLQTLKIRPETVVVQINENIITREDFAETPLHDGDRVEIARFMAGGGGGLHRGE